jgi:hypothetical protein
MAPMTDDRDIRQALADLTDGQPPVPPGRFTAVRRRAVRHRRQQITGAVLSAVVIAAVAAGVTGLPRLAPAPQATRHVPRWALNWTDHRNGSVPQAVLDGAVVSWLAQEEEENGCCGTAIPTGHLSARQTERFAVRYPVVWYVGQTVNRRHSVVVIFEADGPGGPQLVVGQANASEVMHGQQVVNSSRDSWGLTVVPAPDPRHPAAEIGTYVPGSVPTDQNQNADNWMVVLTAPGVTKLSWETGTPQGTTRRTTMPTAEGLVVTDNGQITTAVRLTGTSTARGYRSFGTPRSVGIPGNGPDAPMLAAPPALAPSVSFSLIMGGSGFGPTFDEFDSFTGAQRRGQHAFYGICYGPQPVRLTIDGHPVGSLTCDSRQHEITVPGSVFTAKGHQLMTRINTGNLTSWQIDFGTIR